MQQDKVRKKERKKREKDKYLIFCQEIKVEWNRLKVNVWYIVEEMREMDQHG